MTKAEQNTETSKDAEIEAAEAEKIHPIGRALLWIETPDNIGRMIGFVAVMCFFLFVGDFVFNRYGHFEMEEKYGFYSLFGFAAFTFIIFAVKLLRYFIERPENYYGDEAVDAEVYPAKGLDVKDYGNG